MWVAGTAVSFLSRRRWGKGTFAARSGERSTPLDGAERNESRFSPLTPNPSPYPAAVRRLPRSTARVRQAKTPRSTTTAAPATRARAATPPGTAASGPPPGAPPGPAPAAPPERPPPPPRARPSTPPSGSGRASRSRRPRSTTRANGGASRSTRSSTRVTTEVGAPPSTRPPANATQASAPGKPCAWPHHQCSVKRGPQFFSAYTTAPSHPDPTTRPPSRCGCQYCGQPRHDLGRPDPPEHPAPLPPFLKAQFEPSIGAEVDAQTPPRRRTGCARPARRGR